MPERRDEQGMVPRKEWAGTPIHGASTYQCGKCGRYFADPHALYDHLDMEHPKGAKDDQRGARRDARRR